MVNLFKYWAYNTDCLITNGKIVFEERGEEGGDALITKCHKRKLYNHGQDYKIE